MIRMSSVIVMLLFFTVSIHAQETAGNKEQFLTVSGKNKKWVNGGVSYIQATGGLTHNMGENIRFGSLKNNIGFGGEIAIGREFSPYWSADIRLGLNTNHCMANWESGIHRYDTFNSGELFINGAYNLTNGILGFKDKRKSNLYVYAGIGGAYTWGLNNDWTDNENQLVLGLRAGLTYAYSFNDRWAAVAALGVTGFGDQFDGMKYDIPFDARLNAQIGVRFRWGKNRKSWVRDPEVKYVDRVEYRVDTVTVVKKVPVEVAASVSDKISAIETVFFGLNSYNIEDSEKEKIQRIADVLKKNPEKVVFVIGSADKETGNNKINERLAANRSDIVAEQLIKTYGISEERIITVSSESQRFSPYRKNLEKNRAAICIVSDFEEE